MMKGDTIEDYTHRADRGDTYAQKESGSLCPCFNGIGQAEPFALGIGQLLQQAHPEQSRMDLCRGVRRQRHLRRWDSPPGRIQANGRGLRCWENRHRSLQEHFKICQKHGRPVGNRAALKSIGIDVWFEKENIQSLSADGELLITIMSSLAQEESRNISENTTWGKRKQLAEGKTSVGYSAFLGYDKAFKVNAEQAKVVKLIYKFFLGGRSFYAITKELEKRGIKSPSGKDKWYISTVRSILTNEK